MLRFVVALLAEAKPLVAHYRLRLFEGPFRIYRGEGIDLIVSGMGKTASAAATAYLQASSETPGNAAWLNVGVAGCGERPIGEGFLVHKIVDRASGRSWYPPQVLSLPCPSAPVLTVDRVEEELAGAWLYEMEAAGFYPTAIRFATAEIVQCYKVVSDDRSHPPRQVSKQAVAELIGAKLDEISRIAEKLTAAAGELGAAAADSPELLLLLQSRHFTASEERELRRLSRRLRALRPESPFPLANLTLARSSRDVLSLLRSELDSLPIDVGFKGRA